MPADGNDDGFDPAEHELLESFFRDEAHEALEELTKKLLAAGADKPGEALLHEAMRRTHSLKGSAGTVGLSTFAELAHALEDRFESVRRRRLAWSQSVLDRLVEAIDALRAYVDVLGDPEAASREAERARARIDAVGGARPEPRRARPAAEPEPEPEPEPERDQDPGAGEPIRDPTTSRTRIPTLSPDGESDRRRDDIAVLRVDPARVDRLMDSVGELVFDRTRIERRVQELRALAQEIGRTREALAGELDGDPSAEPLSKLERELFRQVSLLGRSAAALLEDTEALRRTTTALQDGLTGVRMQTVRALYQRLAPQLRAIARAAGKRVQLSTTGGETEFDKTVAELVADPLVQLLRNAVAHGIEPEEKRSARGKPEIGTITLSARHEGSQVVLEVSDDGAGVDPEALRARLVDSGRWTRSRAELATDDEVLGAIFEAGVSSRDEADQLAGRGFGLDSVRDTVARLAGEMQVSSTPGRGTTFTMRLPLTTAVSNALLFKVGGDVYAIPNVHVLETARIEASSPAIPSHLRVRDDQVPLVVLHQVLGADIPTDARTVPAVVIEYAGRRLAVTCDKIVGPREIVVKSLGPLLAPLPLYAGGTISGSGKVQLILDPASLVRIAHHDDLPASEPARAPSEPPPVGRVLVAEDSRAIRETLVRMLERSGYAVDVAGDGADAWEMLHALPYDALITDLEMPRLDGFALLERLRADESLADLAVVVISSKANARTRDRANRLGVEHLLAKPVSRRQLVRALEKARS